MNCHQQRKCSRKKISEQSKTYIGEKNGNFGNKWINNGVINKMLYKNQEIPEGYKLGKLLSQKEWDNINSARGNIKGRISITNGVDSRYINKDEAIPDGYRRGRTINGLGIPKRPSSKKSSGMRNYVWHTNGVENLIVYKGETTPPNFTPGRTMPTNEWFWATNGVQSIKQKLGEPLPDGFYKGKVYKKPV